jgi:2-polyprenyl-3-methyl-5-hydroxy-6-metoxy-1,4-benzoquinol methylase
MNRSQGNVLLLVLFVISGQLTYIILSYTSSSTFSYPPSSHSLLSSISSDSPSISSDLSLHIQPRDRLQIEPATQFQSQKQDQHQYPYVEPLPSLRLTEGEETEAQKVRKKYGGKGDKLHLGGFIQYDRMGVSNNTWNFMMGPLGVKSLLDLGCGRGISTKYFLDQGAKVLCIEGSHDAVTRSLLPRENIIEHDFTRGPWWPTETYDALWSVEFLEHVGRQYYQNYIHILHQAALIFVTSSNSGGWHHVEVREPWWWQGRFAAAGFIYSEDLTQRVKNAARATCEQALGLRIVNRMMVFINPRVASLPQHDHLFSGDGCIFNDERDVPCDSKRFQWMDPQVDRVPSKYQSLLSCNFISTAKDKDLQSPTPPVMLGIWNCSKNPAATIRGVS